MAVQSGNLLKIPDDLSFREGTHAEALAAVVNSHELIDVKLGDTVLVIGAVAVGCLHCQLAKAEGALRVILSDINEERLNLIRELSGADLIINSTAEDLEARVKEKTFREVKWQS